MDDLSSANYHIIWSVMRDRVYQTPIQDVADLRQCLVDTWSGFSQSIVQAVLTSLQGRTQSCSTASRRLLPTGVLRRRQTETPIRGTRRSRHRQDLHEVRCSGIRRRCSVGVEPAAASHPRPPVDRLLQSCTEDLPV